MENSAKMYREILTICDIVFAFLVLADVGRQWVGRRCRRIWWQLPDVLHKMFDHISLLL